MLSLLLEFFCDPYYLNKAVKKQLFSTSNGKKERLVSLLKMWIIVNIIY